MDEQRKYAIFLPQQSWQHGNSTKLVSDHARRGSAPSRMPSQRQGKSLRGLTNDGRTNDESRFPVVRQNSGQRKACCCNVVTATLLAGGDRYVSGEAQRDRYMDVGFGGSCLA